MNPDPAQLQVRLTQPETGTEPLSVSCCWSESVNKASAGSRARYIISIFTSNMHVLGGEELLGPVFVD